MGPGRSELKVCADRDRDRIPRTDHHFFLSDFLSDVLTPPHHARPGHDVPDLVDGPMPDRDRSLAGAELEMSEPSTGYSEEDANLGTIRGDGIGLFGQMLAREHTVPPGDACDAYTSRWFLMSAPAAAVTIRMRATPRNQAVMSRWCTS
jgi:hypothetical protein